LATWGCIFRALEQEVEDGLLYVMLTSLPASIAARSVCFANFVEVGVEGDVASAELDKETALSTIRKNTYGLKVPQGT
jgi:hypothetical protein